MEQTLRERKVETLERERREERMRIERAEMAMGLGMDSGASGRDDMRRSQIETMEQRFQER